MTEEFPASTVSLARGEMLEWSDEQGSGRNRPQRGEAVQHLLERLVAPGARTLVVGPHDVSLVSGLLERGCLVDVVMRSFPDCQTMAHELAAYSGVRISSCSFEAFGPTDRYDCVVATDGFDRLYSPDGNDAGWGATLAQLLALVNDTGRLVMTLENDLGIDRIVGVETPATGRDSDSWGPARDTDGTRPPSLEALKRDLADDGWVVIASALFSHALAPSLLLTESAFATPQGLVRRLVSDALARDFGDRRVLSDPRVLASQAIRQGLGLALAPAWLLVVSRGQVEDLRWLSSPLAIVGESYDRHWAASYAVDLAVHQPQRALLCPPRLASRSAVQRDIGRLAGTPVPGSTLEESLITLCERDDIRTIRTLLVSYSSWLDREADADSLEGGYAFATPDNVALAEEGPQMLDPSWRLARKLPVDLAVVRGLRRFAGRLLASGSRHPWPAGQDVEALTLTLTAMAGREPSRSLGIEAVRIEAEVAAALWNLSAADEARLMQQMLVEGTLPGQVQGYREALSALARTRQDLRSAQEQLDWWDDTLKRKSRDLDEALQRVQDLHNSNSWRVGRAVTYPLRRAKGATGRD